MSATTLDTAPSLRALARALRRHAAVARVAARQALGERGALIGRAGFYAVILLIFSRLWQVVAERGALPGVPASDMLWYLAVTEWVVLSVPLVHLHIEDDVRSGDIAYRLPRPISYLGARLAEEAGDAGLRLCVLGVGGALLARAMSGAWPSDPWGLLAAVPLGVLACAVTLCFHAAIGLTAIWLQDANPVYWIWQKFAFTLGGLMLPLEIYPAWLRAIAWWTPFAATMHGPAHLVFAFRPAEALGVGLRLAFWALVAAAALAFVYRRALRAMNVNGG